MNHVFLSAMEKCKQVRTLSFFHIINQRQQLLSNFVLLITWIMIPVSFGPVLPENKKLPKLLLATKAGCPRRSRSAERFVETPHLALWQSGSSAISFKMNNASCNSRKMGINKRINQLLPE